MAEYESEATLVDKVKCPKCGHEFEVELTGQVIVDIEPSFDYTELD